jgi:PUA domain protein
MDLFKQSSSTKKMKKWVLSRRDSIEMISKIEGSVGRLLGLPKSTQVQCAEPEEGVVFVSLDGFEFVNAGQRFVPYLGSRTALSLLPQAVVDEGAIRFLLNGADVMRPGIRKLDDWGGVGSLVAVRE